MTRDGHVAASHRIAERLESQYRAHPEGPQCENTKIWVFCNGAGGLGMRLYDKVFGRNTYRAFENFVGYTRENYMTIGADGKLQSLTSYYDPIEKLHSYVLVIAACAPRLVVAADRHHVHRHAA